jgi:orotidine-5'-phosphate decarboxylase
VRTSNPGAADIQGLSVADGSSVSDHLARIVSELGGGGTGRSGLSDVGAVVGATAPDRIAALREAMPHAVFLIPGVGAQGGHVEDLRDAFAPGSAGALVAASRGIVAAHERTGAEPASEARAQAARLREAIWALPAAKNPVNAPV